MASCLRMGISGESKEDTTSFELGKVHTLLYIARTGLEDEVRGKWDATSDRSVTSHGVGTGSHHWRAKLGTKTGPRASCEHGRTGYFSTRFYVGCYEHSRWRRRGDAKRRSAVETWPDLGVSRGQGTDPLVRLLGG